MDGLEHIVKEKQQTRSWIFECTLNDVNSFIKFVDFRRQ